MKSETVWSLYDTGDEVNDDFFTLALHVRYATDHPDHVRKVILATLPLTPMIDPNKHIAEQLAVAASKAAQAAPSHHASP